MSFDVIGAVQIGNRARDAQHAMHRARPISPCVDARRKIAIAALETDSTAPFGIDRNRAPRCARASITRARRARTARPAVP